MSLSARRAWIEISPVAITALPWWTRRSPQGERGLKFLQLVECLGVDLSLSARRAWIEISVTLTVTHLEHVALRKESVD